MGAFKTIFGSSEELIYPRLPQYEESIPLLPDITRPSPGASYNIWYQYYKLTGLSDEEAKVAASKEAKPPIPPVIVVEAEPTWKRYLPYIIIGIILFLGSKKEK